MGVPGAVQVRLSAPRPSVVSSWILPAYVVTMKSPSIMMAVGDDHFIVRRRIAEALSIHDGDTLQVEFTDVGEVVSIPNVKISDNIVSDILIHDLLTMGIARGFAADHLGEQITFASGKVLNNPDQHMWAGMRAMVRKGEAMLRFDGATRNNPHGSAGYGFSIVKPSGEPLIQGFGYAGEGKTNNEMEYSGLLEGLIWASRLDLGRLSIYGDSELVIRQMTGEYQVREPRLVELSVQIRKLLRDDEMVVEYHHFPRDKNTVADALAQMAIDTKTNMTSCNWPNINRVMHHGG